MTEERIYADYLEDILDSIDKIERFIEGMTSNLTIIMMKKVM